MGQATLFQIVLIQEKAFCHSVLNKSQPFHRSRHKPTTTVTMSKSVSGDRRSSNHKSKSSRSIGKSSKEGWDDDILRDESSSNKGSRRSAGGAATATTPSSLNNFFETKSFNKSEKELDWEDRSRGAYSTMSKMKRSSRRRSSKEKETTSSSKPAPISEGSEKAQELMDKLDSFLVKSRSSTSRHPDDERSRGAYSTMSKMKKSTSSSNKSKPSSSPKSRSTMDRLGRSDPDLRGMERLGKSNPELRVSEQPQKSRESSSSKKRHSDVSDDSKLGEYFDTKPRRKVKGSSKSVFTSAEKERARRSRRKHQEAEEEVELPPIRDDLPSVKEELLSFLATLPKKPSVAEQQQETPKKEDDKRKKEKTMSAGKKARGRHRIATTHDEERPRRSRSRSIGVGGGESMRSKSRARSKSRSRGEKSHRSHSVRRRPSGAEGSHSHGMSAKSGHKPALRESHHSHKSSTHSSKGGDDESSRHRRSESRRRHSHAAPTLSPEKDDKARRRKSRSGKSSQEFDLEESRLSRHERKSSHKSRSYSANPARDRDGKVTRESRRSTRDSSLAPRSKSSRRAPDRTRSRSLSPAPKEKQTAAKNRYKALLSKAETVKDIEQKIETLSKSAGDLFSKAPAPTSSSQHVPMQRRFTEIGEEALNLQLSPGFSDNQRSSASLSLAEAVGMPSLSHDSGHSYERKGATSPKKESRAHADATTKKSESFDAVVPASSSASPPSPRKDSKEQRMASEPVTPNKETQHVAKMKTPQKDSSQSMLDHIDPSRMHAADAPLSPVKGSVLSKDASPMAPRRRSSTATGSAKKSNQTVEPQVEYKEEDVFTYYSWSNARQDPRKIAKERKALKDSIRDTPLYRAFLRIEASVASN